MGGGSGEGESFKSSSMSQAGLGSRGRGGGAISLAVFVALSFPLPLPALEGPTTEAEGSALAWERRCAWSGMLLVELVRKGFSKASLSRLTFTCPNPGSLSNWSDVAFAMSAKLCKKASLV